MKKRITLALLSISLLTLAACGGGPPTREQAIANMERRLGSDLVGLRDINAMLIPGELIEEDAEDAWSVTAFFEPPASSDNFIYTAAFVTSHAFDFLSEQDSPFILVTVTLVGADDEILKSMTWIDLDFGTWVDHLTGQSRRVSLEELHELAAAMP